MKYEMDKMREVLWMIEFLTYESMIKRPVHFEELFKVINPLFIWYLN